MSDEDSPFEGKEGVVRNYYIQKIEKALTSGVRPLEVSSRVRQNTWSCVHRKKASKLLNKNPVSVT